MMDLSEHLYTVLHPHKVNLCLQNSRLGHVQHSLSQADLQQSIQMYLLDKEITEEYVSQLGYISHLPKGLYVRESERIRARVFQ